MRFEIDTMEPEKYPIGSIHTVIHWNAGKSVQRTGRVVAHKSPRPAIYMASFPIVVLEEIQ